MAGGAGRLVGPVQVQSKAPSKGSVAVAQDRGSDPQAVLSGGTGVSGRSGGLRRCHCVACS